MIAAYKNSRDIAEMLVTAGANISLQDQVTHKIRSRVKQCNGENVHRIAGLLQAFGAMLT